MTGAVITHDGTPQCEPRAEIAERLARQIDDLTAIIENLARHNAVVLDMVASQLGEVHVELDELAASTHRSEADR